MKFQIDQLRYDNERLKGEVEQERRTVEVIRKAYNSKQALEYRDVSMQTEGQ